MKILILNFLLSSIISAQISIKIYNQGWAMIQEERKKNFSSLGKQNLLISNLPHSVDPSSINLFSDEIQIISKEFIYNPPSIESMLNTNIGNEIELINYGEDGNITFSKMGKLLSNTNFPIFEIDGKIVINPPYNYQFLNIPNNINDNPYLNCSVNVSSIKTNYKLSYFTSKIDWVAEYNIYTISENSAKIEGWYSIKNNNAFSYENANISLISGEINFQQNNNHFNSNILKNATMARNTETYTPSIEIKEIENYHIFNIPNKINLSAQSQTRHIFLLKENLIYKNVYHISHSLSRHQWKIPKETINIPVFIRMEIPSNNIGEFQIPGGQYKVYEKNENDITFIGTDFHRIVDEKDIIKLELGRSNEILCSFSIAGFKIDKHKGKAQVNATFDNRKDKSVLIKWIEKYNEGSWKITECNHDYKKIDAYKTEFSIIVPAKSKKEINFYATMEKNNY